MWHQTIRTFFLLLCVTLFGCKGSNPAEIDLLECGTCVLLCSHKAQSQSVEIVSTEQFRLTPSPDAWCTSSYAKVRVEGEKVRYRIYLHLTENTTSQLRETHLGLACGRLYEVLTIVQDSLPAVPEPQPEEPQDAIKFAMTMAPGWNLGNNLDAAINGVANETSWGNSACTQKTMERVREAGFRSVRIPISWIGHFGEAPDYTIRPEWINRVKEVVGYAHNAGLKAIINIHHDGNPDVARQNYWLDIRRAVEDEAYNTQVKHQLAALWTQIANGFKEEGDYLIFEDLNEITDGQPHSGDKTRQMAVLNQWNQVFVDAVRATGGNNATRYLAIASFYARCDLAVRYLAIPHDEIADRVMVSVHSYDPWSFAGAGTDRNWGHTGSQHRQGESECVERLKSLYDRFVSRGIPVYMGECGAVNRANNKETAYQRYYLEYYAKAAASYYIPFFLWDNGTDHRTGEEAFGYLNHANGLYINDSQPLIDALVRAQTDKSAEYTLESIYDRSPQ